MITPYLANNLGSMILDETKMKMLSRLSKMIENWKRQVYGPFRYIILSHGRINNEIVIK